MMLQNVFGDSGIVFLGSLCRNVALGRRDVFYRTVETFVLIDCDYWLGVEPMNLWES